MRRALIAGLAGPETTASERAFFADVKPAGMILFARNCITRAQIKRLIDDIRDAVAHEDFLVLIDQEGGRVQRLRPPLGRQLPPARSYGTLYGEDQEAAVSAARDVAQLMASDLGELGINTNCAPVLDLPVKGAHDIIGDRAYGSEIAQVVALARAVAEGFIKEGVLPVMKHIPGHGRATADSHHSLPIVEAAADHLYETDFAPFKSLSDLPAAMTAHVVFNRIDPVQPASVSSQIIQKVIREDIGFAGLLMSDDLSMKALSGTIGARASAVIDAGSDVALHCNGQMDEMMDAANGTPNLSGKALERFQRVCAVTRQKKQPLDRSKAEAALARVLAL